MSLTPVVKPRSQRMVITSAISSGETPVYVQIAVTMGMSISGKTSAGMRTMEITPSNKIASAITTNVYGRRSASLTIHIPLPSIMGVAYS